MNKTKKRVVITNKKRFFSFLLLAVVFVNLLVVYPCIPKNTQADIVHKTQVIRVCAGDTLWSIAKDYCKSNEDIRNVVYEIKKINAINDATLTVGQELIVPVK